MLDVGGVGFQVLVPSSVLSRASIGDNLFLNTVLIVREDGFTLFGFSDIEQLELFDHLRSVSGVGPKTALGVLSNLSSGEIANAVADEDSVAFQRVPGVGAKTAKLIVVTLGGKLKALESDRSADSNDLLLAMQSLGWAPRHDAASAIAATARWYEAWRGGADGRALALAEIEEALAP